MPCRDILDVLDDELSHRQGCDCYHYQPECACVSESAYTRTIRFTHPKLNVIPMSMYILLYRIPNIQLSYDCPSSPPCLIPLTIGQM